MSGTESFQAASSQQGKQFADQCDVVLVDLGFKLSASLRLPEIGVEIDRVAESPTDQVVWFEFKGSVRGHRPGLMRTDTLKKAIANAALVGALDEHPPYVLLTSHLPESGAGLAMLQTALALGLFADILCIYNPTDLQRLRAF